MTRGFVKVEDEVTNRLRRNAMLARSADADDQESRRRLEEAIAVAILLSWVVGATAASSWVEGRGNAVTVARNLGDAMDRLRRGKYVAEQVAIVELQSVSMGGEVARQIAARGVETMAAFMDMTVTNKSPDHAIKAAIETVAKGQRRPEEPLVRQAVTALRKHERKGELMVRQASYAAYNDGVAAVGLSELARAKFPVWRIDETMDEVTRGNPDGEYPEPHRHWQFSGYINTMEEIVAQRIVPPNGWNCRASLVPIAWSDAAVAGFVKGGAVDDAAIRKANGPRQALIDEGLYPDRGFVKSQQAQ